LLVEARPDPTTDPAGRQRGDARWVYVARDAGARKPRLPPIAPHRRAVEQQGSGHPMGAFHLEAWPEPEGDLDSRDQISELQAPNAKHRRRAKSRGNGRHALRPVPGPVPAALLAAALRGVLSGLFECELFLRERRETVSMAEGTMGVGLRRG